MSPKSRTVNRDLVIELHDVYGEFLHDRVDVHLQHTVLSDSPSFYHLDASEPIRIPDLKSENGGLYKLQVLGRNYRDIGAFVRIPESREIVKEFVVPVRPSRVRQIDFPPFSKLPSDLQLILCKSSVVSFGDASGNPLYDQLDDPRKAGLLNIYWKMYHTTYSNGANPFSHVRSFVRILGDRFFAHVDAELVDLTENSVHSGLFEPADYSLHHPGLPGYVAFSSYKTHGESENYGNLQLTFAYNRESDSYLVDADIDDAKGIGHIFQVLRNFVTGKPTNPYDIHEILMAYQNIDPHYKFVFPNP